MFSFLLLFNSLSESFLFKINLVNLLLLLFLVINKLGDGSFLILFLSSNKLLLICKNKFLFNFGVSCFFIFLNLLNEDFCLVLILFILILLLFLGTLFIFVILLLIYKSEDDIF